MAILWIRQYFGLGIRIAQGRAIRSLSLPPVILSICQSSKTRSTYTSSHPVVPPTTPPALITRISCLKRAWEWRTTDSQDFAVLPSVTSLPLRSCRLSQTFLTSLSSSLYSNISFFLPFLPSPSLFIRPAIDAAESPPRPSPARPSQPRFSLRRRRRRRRRSLGIFHILPSSVRHCRARACA